MSSRKSFDIAGISAKLPGSASLAIGAGVLLLLVLGLYLVLRPAGEQAATSYDIRLYPFVTEAGLEVGYRPQEPVSDLLLPLPEEVFDALSVTMSAETVSLEKRRGGIGLHGSEPFDLVSILIDRSIKTPVKDYPLVQYGTRDAVVNIARWQPVEVNGKKVSGSSQGPLFYWVGTPEIWQGDGIMMLYEPALPAALQGIIGNSVAVLNDYYGTVLGAAPEDGLQVMMLYTGGNGGQISVEGDTVPGQALIRFVGQGFMTEGQEAKRRALQNIAHEMAHLWQLEATGVSAAPDWLHEGAAEAIGLESLYLTEKYDDADYADLLGAARRDCGAALREGPVDRAAARGSHAASYACGVMVWAALSGQREGATVAATWRAFADFAAERKDGQSAAAFYAFAEEWGSERFARSARQFITADYSGATGTVIVDGLFAADL